MNNPTHHTCPTCGYSWLHGQHGGHSCATLMAVTIAEKDQEIERLKGLQPDMPPRPPEGDGLPRYGLRWNGPGQPLCVPMDDGYWTPWHLAAMKAHPNGVVLPERREVGPQYPYLSDSDVEWNGCLDEVARLNSSPASDAALDILAERQRQITAEGWTPDHDDEHDGGELAAAAAAYALHAADHMHPYSQGDGGNDAPSCWPWHDEVAGRGEGPANTVPAWWKPGTPRRNLIKAGALILAEVERLDRAEQAKQQERP